MRHLFAASLLALTACGDGSGPSDAIPAALAGSWEAAPGCLPNCGFTLVRISDSADSLNFVSAQGQTFLLTLTRSGGFDLVTLPQGAAVRGQVEAEGALLILRDDSGARDTVDYVLAGDFLGLAFRGISEDFDFDGDQVADPATIRARFRRR